MRAQKRLPPPQGPEPPASKGPYSSRFVPRLTNLIETPVQLANTYCREQRPSSKRCKRQALLLSAVHASTLASPSASLLRSGGSADLSSARPQALRLARRKARCLLCGQASQMHDSSNCTISKGFNLKMVSVFREGADSAETHFANHGFREAVTSRRHLVALQHTSYDCGQNPWQLARPPAPISTI